MTTTPAGTAIHTPDAQVFRGEASGSVPELIADASSYLSIAYNGLRAAILERRINRATNAVNNTSHDVAFYHSLSDTANSVIHGIPDLEGVNFPPPPTEKGALTSMAKSRKKVEDYKLSHRVISGSSLAMPGTELSKIEEPKPHELGRRVSPRNARQLREERLVAERLNFIRDRRKSQVRRANVFGEAGLYSAYSTRREKIHNAHVYRKNYKAGNIDSFEYLAGKRARKALQVNKNTPVQRKTAATLDILSNGAVGGINGMAARAQVKGDRAAERRRDKLQPRLEQRREKQRQARERLSR